MRRSRQLEIWLPIVIVVVDQITKAAVRAMLPLHASVTIVPGFVDFTHVRNTGAAFGILNAADFRFKTFNGGIYSDFPVTTMPLQAPTKEERGGKVVFRADRFTAARISNGGPEIKIENLNGDIRILENHE